MPEKIQKETSFPREQIKILLLENIHKNAHDVFAAHGYGVKALSKAISENDLCDAIHDVHLLGIRSKTQVTAKVLESANRLLSVGCFCIGTNQIDLMAAKRLGVPVFNAPFSNTRSVAELVIAEIIALSRQLADRSSEMHQGQWQKTSTGCFEVRSKVLGIVGYGHIGAQVGVLAEAMGMRVLFYDIAARLPLGNAKRMDSLHELMASVDFVTLHVPETPQTKMMLNTKALQQMKKGSFVLNLSRGTVIDIPALAEAIRAKHLAGAALDVYPLEPESNDQVFISELQKLRNVILTPHIGGATEEAQAAIGIEVADRLIGYIDKGVSAGAVNFPQVDLPSDPGAHRILNIHKNVPGVLKDINKIVGDLHANIRAQVLSTDEAVGYLVMDLEKNVANDVRKAIQKLDTNIKTRILY